MCGVAQHPAAAATPVLHPSCRPPCCAVNRLQPAPFFLGREMEARAPRQCRAWVGFSVKMAHRITAGGCASLPLVCLPAFDAWLGVGCRENCTAAVRCSGITVAACLSTVACRRRPAADALPLRALRAKPAVCNGLRYRRVETCLHAGRFSGREYSCRPLQAHRCAMSAVGSCSCCSCELYPPVSPSCPHPQSLSCTLWAAWPTRCSLSTLTKAQALVRNRAVVFDLLGSCGVLCTAQHPPDFAPGRPTSCLIMH